MLPRRSPSNFLLRRLVFEREEERIEGLPLVREWRVERRVLLLLRSLLKNLACGRAD